MSLAVFLLAGLSGSLPRVEPESGYLYQPAFSVDYELRGPVRAYVPEPGDIFLATEDWFIPRFGHVLAHSGAPHHSGIIFALPDGRMALLEAGPESTLHIRILDLVPQMTKYFATKRVWIRKRCVPLTPEQSRRLTAFALSAADRPFAALRMAKEVGPLRGKGPLRTRLFGRPHAAHFDPADPSRSMRGKYFCSELVTESLVAAQLLDPTTARPTSMYPRELFFGTSRIPYIRRHLDLSGWEPPARWTPCPGAVSNIRPRPWIDGDAGSGLRSRP